MSKAKYHATKVHTEEGIFDSKLEYYRWIELQVMEEKGIISDLHRQVAFVLLPKQPLKSARKRKGGSLQHCETAVKYIADFTYKRDGHLIVEDVKGMKTADYILKRKLMLYIHGIQIQEVH